MSPLFTRVQIRSVSEFVPLCCEFTQVKAFTPWHKMIEIYLDKYLSTFFSVLVFIRIDLNRMLFLRITSKRIKVIRSDIYTFLQFTRLNMHSVNGALIFSWVHSWWVYLWMTNKAAYLLRLFRKRNTCNKFFKLHLFQLKWNRNKSSKSFQIHQNYSSCSCSSSNSTLWGRIEEIDGIFFQSYLFPKMSHSIYYSSIPSLPIPKNYQKECNLTHV